MGHLTIMIRAALASTLGVLGLAASYCAPLPAEDAEASVSAPAEATVSDQPVHARVTDGKPAATTPDSASAAPADRGSGEPASNKQQPPLPFAPSRLVDAIEDARQSRGSLLEGSVLLTPGEDSRCEQHFSRALAQAAAEEAAAAQSATTHFVPVPVEMPESLEGSDLLRRAARELELRAADSEDQRQFEQADGLRRLSTRLRREARRWDERAAFSPLPY